MMTARWLAFAVWAGTAASVLFWGLRWFVHPTPAPGFTRVVATAASPQGDLSRLFGGDAPAVAAAAPATPSRLHLLGVVAPHGDAAAREGLALIAVDGKPARSYRVGAVVDGDLVLQDVQPRGVSLGPRDGAANVKLEIPAPVAAATGTPPLQGATMPPAAPPAVRPSFGAVAPAPPVEAEPQPAAPAVGHPLPTL